MPVQKCLETYWMHNFIYIDVKFTTVVKSDQKAPFSIATTPRFWGTLFFSMDCSTLRLIFTLYCWVLSKEVSSTVFKVIGMTQPGIELRSPGPLANTFIIIFSCHQHGYPWPSLATSPYPSSLLAGTQGYIPYPHRAAVCRFELVAICKSL